MINLTVDGIKIEIPNGSVIMDAIKKAGSYVPYFCYHKKLSIVANCRMCLIEIDGISKLLPACATIAKSDMVVYTYSEKVKSGQASIMEFLLINHPLDCPICDQGGECQLQDLAVGYGYSNSRYVYEKRIVFHKNMGPLISAQEMSRCIHCTRCIRFGEEIAGLKELGMLGRGEHSEISSFLSRSIDSELSGNMIDICPVGALTSKPFRYTARTWELSRRFSISPHDSFGTNLTIQTKDNRVMRVVPFENELINESWISDRDRFSYLGLNSNDRLLAPLVKCSNNEWKEASWTDALKKVAFEILKIKKNFGSDEIGSIASEYSTIEEYNLLSQITRSLGSENIDFRLRQTDTAFDSALTGIPWLGMTLQEIDNLDQVLIVGSFLRKDHPLIATKFRQAAKKGTKIFLIDSYEDDPLMPISGRITVTPSFLSYTLAQICVALFELMKKRIPSEFSSVYSNEQSRKIAETLIKGSNIAVLLGNLAISLPDASTLAANSAMLANLINGKLGFLTSGANTLGGYLAEAIPKGKGKTAKLMFSQHLKGYLILHAEPYLDLDNGEEALYALKNAKFSVAMTPYLSDAQNWADVILPVSPFTETSGTFINAQGNVQSFENVVSPLKKTRPAWKVLCDLANFLELEGFNYETSKSIRDSILKKKNINKSLSNNIRSKIGVGNLMFGLERITDIPIYRSDPIVRHSAPLQLMKESQLNILRINKNTLRKLELPENVKKLEISNLKSNIQLKVIQDNSVPDRGLKISGTFSETIKLGGAFSELYVKEVI
ncbi:MAG: NADH-quinone oxidoreductase subunit G [Bordetella sp.]|nr:MAG: NADH-quinone oxidoreductase subunit G [Bordetella sp.]